MNAEENIESRYRAIFGQLQTRKKFSIHKIDGKTITIEEFQEICGQKEPKRMDFHSTAELETFVRRENDAEKRIQANLTSNEFPMR